MHHEASIDQGDVPYVLQGPFDRADLPQRRMYVPRGTTHSLAPATSERLRGPWVER